MILNQIFSKKKTKSYLAHNVLQGLRYSAGIREDFVATRLSLMQWLTQVDMAITNVQLLSQSDIDAKLKEIQVPSIQYLLFYFISL